MSNGTNEAESRLLEIKLCILQSQTVYSCVIDTHDKTGISPEFLVICLFH
jgi:hypothetical protein